MRNLLILDNKIKSGDYEEWRNEDVKFWKKYSDVTPEYTIIKRNLSFYPTYFDSDGDVRPTNTFLQTIVDEVVTTHGEFAFDFILLCVHEDNWRSSGPIFDQLQRDSGINKKRGIWGTNYSYVFGSQNFQYCRWDKNNLANVFGTLYHERTHSFDAITKVETGVDIRLLLKVGNFDRAVVHGGTDPWEYIRYKENTEAIKRISPHLRNAFRARKAKHETNNQRKTLIDTLQELVYLYKKLINRKNGVSL